MNHNSHLLQADLPGYDISEHMPHLIDVARRNLERYITAAIAEPESSLLRPGQLPVFQSTLGALDTHGPRLRGYYSLPTGAGKSHLLPRIVDLMKIPSITATPKKHLAHKTKEAFAAIVGADNVGLLGDGIAEIGRKHTITTHHSLATRSAVDPAHPKRTVLRARAAGVLMLDEVHRALGPETQETLRKYYQHALIIGSTATERVNSQKHVRDFLPTEIHKITSLEAQSLGMICPWSNWVLETNMDISDVKLTPNHHYDSAELQHQLNNETRNNLIVEMYRKRLAGRSTFAYCAGVKHSFDLAEAFRKQGIRAYAAHGGTPTQEVKRLLTQLDAGEIDVICSDQLLLEGTDVPSASACINAVPLLEALARARQRGGRPLRIDERNPRKKAIIVDVVDIDRRRPPILFCHPEVGQTADPVDNTYIADEYLSVGGLKGRLIRAPSAVQEMQQNFAQRRIAPTIFPPVPPGWTPYGELAKTYGLTIPQVTKFTKRLIKRDPDLDAHRMRCLRPDKRTADYISPTLEAQFAALVKEQAKTEVVYPPAPPRWQSTGEIEAIYDYPNAHATLKRIAQKVPDGYGNFENPLPGTTRPRTYFSPEIIRRFVIEKKLKYVPPGTLPPRWEAVPFHTDAERTAVDHAIATLRHLIQPATYIDFNTFEVDGKAHYSPKLRQRIIEQMHVPDNWYSDTDLARELGIAEETINDCATQFSAALLAPNSRMRVADGTAKLYFSPLLIQVLRARLAA